MLCVGNMLDFCTLMRVRMQEALVSAGLRCMQALALTASVALTLACPVVEPAYAANSLGATVFNSNCGKWTLARWLQPMHACRIDPCAHPRGFLGWSPACVG